MKFKNKTLRGPLVSTDQQIITTILQNVITIKAHKTDQKAMNLPVMEKHLLLELQFS